MAEVIAEQPKKKTIKSPQLQARQNSRKKSKLQAIEEMLQNLAKSTQENMQALANQINTISNKFDQSSDALAGLATRLRGERGEVVKQISESFQQFNARLGELEGLVVDVEDEDDDDIVETEKEE